MKQILIAVMICFFTGSVYASDPTVDYLSGNALTASPSIIHQEGGVTIIAYLLEKPLPRSIREVVREDLELGVGITYAVVGEKTLSVTTIIANSVQERLLHGFIAKVLTKHYGQKTFVVINPALY